MLYPREATLGEKKVVKVLAIDGGGIRGVIPATFCKHLETITGSNVPMWKFFDFIVGTSTGGIMTMLLTRPDPDNPGQAKFSADDCIDLYLRHGKDLFSAPPEYMERNQKHELPVFPESSVVTTLQDFLPKPGCELKEALTEVAVTAYNLTTGHPWLFTSFDAKKSADSNFYMRDVAQASSAFPGLFAAARVTSVGGKRSMLCVDGGMSGASPILQAYMHASQVTRAAQSVLAGVEQLLSDYAWDKDAPGSLGAPMPLIFAEPDPDLEVIVLSLGTGHYLKPIAYDETDGWGFSQWADVMPDVMFDATTHTAEEEARTFLGTDNYFRFQVDLPGELNETANVKVVETLHAVADEAMSEGGELYPELQRLRSALASPPRQLAQSAG
jgi:predicted acylesterase/phospholipase RssA